MILLPLLILLLSGEPPQGTVAQGAASPKYLIAAGKGSAQLLLNAANGSKEAALTLLVLAPGGEIPEHVHETSAELIYIEQGAVQMTIDGRSFEAHRGDAIYIPPNVKHSAKVTSKLQPVQAVQIYVGPGPEQRFTKGPKLEGD
jgi:quercetin dioxygenase-like cupin family protein